MKPWLLPVLSLLSAGSLAPLAQADLAGIPIIYGHGETIADLGSLPPDVAEDIRKEIGQEVSVGYMFNRFHIYHGDLWTWNGRHVLYHGDRYWALDDAQWREILGTSVEAKYGKPLRYRFPIGLTVLVTVLFLWIVGPRLIPNPQRKLQKLFEDARYTAALETVFPQSEPL